MAQTGSTFAPLHAGANAVSGTVWPVCEGCVVFACPAPLLCPAQPASRFGHASRASLDGHKRSAGRGKGSASYDAPDDLLINR